MSVSAVSNGQSILVRHLLTRTGMRQDAWNGGVLVQLIEKAQQDLSAVTPIRGQLINIKV